MLVSMLREKRRGRVRRRVRRRRVRRRRVRRHVRSRVRKRVRKRVWRRVTRVYRTLNCRWGRRRDQRRNRSDVTPDRERSPISIRRDNGGYDVRMGVLERARRWWRVRAVVALIRQRRLFEESTRQRWRRNRPRMMMMVMMSGMSRREQRRVADGVVIFGKSRVFLLFNGSRHVP